MTAHEVDDEGVEQRAEEMLASPIERRAQAEDRVRRHYAGRYDGGDERPPVRHGGDVTIPETRPIEPSIGQPSLGLAARDERRRVGCARLEGGQVFAFDHRQAHTAEAAAVVGGVQLASETCAPSLRRSERGKRRSETLGDRLFALGPDASDVAGWNVDDVGICVNQASRLVADGGVRRWPQTCAELKAGDANLSDGIYVIDSDGTGGRAPFYVFCDMTTAGGGWTRVGFERAKQTGARRRRRSSRKIDAQYELPLLRSWRSGP